MNTIPLVLQSNELACLRDLLRYESIYQMKGKIDATPDKIVDAYRSVDDQLRIFEFKGKKGQTTFAVDRGVCGLYISLCTKTVQMELPPEVLTRAEDLAPHLVAKFEAALGTEPTVNNDLKINVFGSKGQA